jgi:hypothetical protein
VRAPVTVPALSPWSAPGALLAVADQVIRRWPRPGEKVPVAFARRSPSARLHSLNRAHRSAPMSREVWRRLEPFRGCQRTSQHRAGSPTCRSRNRCRHLRRGREVRRWPWSRRRRSGAALGWCCAGAGAGGARSAAGWRRRRLSRRAAALQPGYRRRLAQVPVAA